MSRESDEAFTVALNSIGVSKPDLADDLKKFWDAGVEWRSKYWPVMIHFQYTAKFSAGSHRAACGARGLRDRQTLTLNEKEVTCRRCKRYWSTPVIAKPAVLVLPEGWTIDNGENKKP